MKVLIAYPNLPLMLTPALSVGLFTSIIKSLGCEVDLFETTSYSDTGSEGFLFKSKLGSGRSFNYQDLGVYPKPTQDMIPDFVNRVTSYKPDLILYSVVEDTYHDALMMMESVKDQNILSIVGGVFAINAPEVCISNDLISIICRYEGESVVHGIVKALRDKTDWRDVPGIWYKENGKVVKNPFQPLVDLNNVIPDYSLFHKDRFLRPIGGRIVRAIQLETYRGCPYSCTFCNSPMTRKMDKQYLRRKTNDQIRKELDYYLKEFNPDYWFIIDDSFLARPRKEMFELLSVIQEYNIPWWCNTRLENVDEELLAAMKAAHCDRIQFGIESGDEEYRKTMLKRPITNEVYYEKAKALNNSGIPYGLNIIVGMPDETKEHVFKTVDLVRNIKGYDGLSISVFIPYRGTELRDIAVEKGYVDKDWLSNEGLQSIGSILKMPKQFLQKEDLDHIVPRLKYYCFFNKDYWGSIDASEDLSFFENIYNEFFFQTPVAVPGKEKILERQNNIWACEADPYVAY
jgi:anaerobic magnesium-protoporphyrin IX monomethyl ester cyclase